MIKKRYVYRMGRKLQLTCLVHGMDHYWYHREVLSDFGKRYSTRRPTKYINYDNSKRYIKEVRYDSNYNLENYHPDMGDDDQDLYKLEN